MVHNVGTTNALSQNVKQQRAFGEVKAVDVVLAVYVYYLGLPDARARFHSDQLFSTINAPRLRSLR
jgi:hypothetical protein